MNAIDHKPFLDSIDEKPEDDALKLIYSDWLLENNLVTAATVWKWLGTTGRYPAKTPYLRGFRYTFGDETNMRDVLRCSGSQSCLPNILLWWLENPWGAEYSHQLMEDTAVEAIQAIVKVWEPATQKRRLFTSWQFVPSWERINVVSAEEAEYRLKLKL